MTSRGGEPSPRGGGGTHPKNQRGQTLGTLVWSAREGGANVICGGSVPSFCERVLDMAADVSLMGLPPNR
jgi:hypothetical protein